MTRQGDEIRHQSPRPSQEKPLGWVPGRLPSAAASHPASPQASQSPIVNRKSLLCIKGNYPRNRPHSRPRPQFRVGRLPRFLVSGSICPSATRAVGRAPASPALPSSARRLEPPGKPPWGPEPRPRPTPCVPPPPAMAASRPREQERAVAPQCRHASSRARGGGGPRKRGALAFPTAGNRAGSLKIRLSINALAGECVGSGCPCVCAVTIAVLMCDAQADTAAGRCPRAAGLPEFRAVLGDPAPQLNKQGDRPSGQGV